jgi:Flp pilus assembly protein TadD|tara:strand:+ start:284 stop:1765 length:1482 start_codon:yes stop_codon:yes gene_type:complete
MVEVSSPSQVQVTTLLEHYQSGRYVDAEKLALSITEQFPGHQLSWKVLGAVFKLKGMKTESLKANQTAVKLIPQDAAAHNNLGVALKELGRLEEAQASYRQAIAVKSDFAEAHCNLGNMLQKLGRVEEAEASYRQAIAIKSDFAEAHCNLGATFQKLGRVEEAEASYRQAIAIKSDYAEAHNNLGVMLQELDRFEEAEASYRQAIEVKSDFAEAHYNLGVFLKKFGKFAAAAEHFKLSNFGKSQSYLLRCLYMQNKEALFFDQLDYLNNQGETNAVIGSLGCRSAQRYGIEKPNLFCKDPLKYVLKTDLNNQYDFKKIFVNTSNTILNENRVPFRTQDLLTNGFQTYGNLFSLDADFTAEMEKIIREEVEKYRVHFKDSEEGLITHWPGGYNISSWLIGMKSGGALKPHMHEMGWLSGSIYINVPSKSQSDSGNLVVCIEDEEFIGEEFKNQKKIIDVVTGSLVLFPASLLHYTIPFESEEERIVLAFDVEPK